MQYIYKTVRDTIQNDIKYLKFPSNLLTFTYVLIFHIFLMLFVQPSRSQPILQNKICVEITCYQ